MKFTIDRKELLNALGIVRPAAGRGNLPILAHVAISTFEKSVEFYCTNLNVTLRAKAPADVDDKGATTVRVSLLHDLVRSFTGETVTLELVKDSVSVTCERSKFRLSTLAIEEFPPVAKLRDAEEFELPQPMLHRLLAVTSFCACRDEARYVLQSILLQVNGKETTAVATDGRRLALDVAQSDAAFRKPREIVLPSFAADELLRLLDDGSKIENEDDPGPKLRVVMAENIAQFWMGDVVLTTKLIEGNYPNYRQVIPSTKGKGIVIGRADLLLALQRASLFSDVCTLDFRKQALNIRAVGDTTGDSSESLMIPPIANPVKLTCQISFLTEALSVIKDGEIQIHVTDAVEPISFKAEKKRWLAVIMPRRGNEEPPSKVEKPEPTPETKPEAKAAEPAVA